MKRVVQEGKELTEPLAETNRATAASAYGFPGTPAWVGDKTLGGGAARMVDTSESLQYINRKTGGRAAKASSGPAEGPSLALLAHHVATQEGGLPGGGNSGGDEGGSPSGPGGAGAGGHDAASLSKAIRIARDANDEDAFFAPSRYQEFSREPIVFYKRVVNDQKMLKWTVKAGEAFKRKTKTDLKFFLPITLAGQVLGSYQLVTYKMNLELIKISDTFARHLDAFKFETIWPFVLYLFNYWVKNQASLMLNS